MTPRSYVVVEGNLDSLLLNRVLADEVAAGDVGIFHAVSPVSAARSLLVVRRVPVAILCDSDTTDAERLQENRDELEDALAAAGPRNSWRLIFAVPELESCFFDDAAFLTAAGLRVPTAELAERARFKPKEVLATLLREAGIPSESAFIAGLPDAALNILRNGKLIGQVFEFVNDSVASTAA